MAYPEEVVPPLPETLPEDFSDWDGEASPALLPGISTEVDNGRVHSEAPRPRGQASYRDAVRASASRAQRMWGSNPPEPSFGRQQSELSSWQRETSAASMSRNSGEVEVTHALSENAEPLGQSAEREVLLSPAVDRPRDSRAASSATAAATPKMSTTGLAEELPNYVSQSLDDSQAVKGASAKTGSSAAAIADGARNIPEISEAKMREADEAIYQLFSVKNVEVAQKQKPSRNKWVMVAAVGGLSILLSFALTLLLGHHGAKAAANLPVQSFSGATVTLVKANAAKPSAGEPLAQGQLQAVAGDQQAPDNLQTQANDGASSAPTITQAQTQMMNDQLAAPRMIPQGATKQVAEDTPPPANFAANGADGLGAAHGAMPSVFNGHAQSIVVAPPPKPMVISSGVAVGMLIQKTPPVYPPIAKSARVSGTVVLHAVISKNGAITDLRAVSGPDMLRQAALDAVRNWRYKPYKLNNDPVDVETTINVVFTLGG